MPWSPPASNAVNPVWEHEGIWLQCFPMPYPPPYQREERSRTLVHDQLGPHKFGLTQRAPPIRPVPYDWSDRSQQRPAQFAPPRMEYRVKEKKQEVQPSATTEKAKANTVVHIGEINVVVQDKG